MTGRYLRRKIKKLGEWIGERPYKIRQWYVLKRVKSRDFTIISNNCWAGSVYRYFHMPYLSPTVGLYFFAEDYLKFISNLHHYLDTKLEFVPAKSSRYSEELERRNQLNIPIGVLDDIEVIFLHYSSEQEAKEKWDRRKERVNWDNVFVKFSRMNQCEEEHIEHFCELPFTNKFVFNTSKSPSFPEEYYWNGPQNSCEIIRDTRPFPGNISISKLLNRKPERYPEMGLTREKKKKQE